MADADPPASLDNVVFGVLADWFAKQSDASGIVTAFTLVVERIRDDGNTGLTVVSPAGQSPAHTLGLVGWAEEHTRDEVRYIINSPFLVAAEDDEAED